MAPASLSMPNGPMYLPREFSQHHGYHNVFLDYFSGRSGELLDVCGYSGIGRLYHLRHSRNNRYMVWDDFIVLNDCIAISLQPGTDQQLQIRPYECSSIIHTDAHVVGVCSPYDQLQ